jgi:carbon-monoxide dehydrogenase large subunit
VKSGASGARGVEDVRFLTGRGRYDDDIAAPGAAVAEFLLSPHLAARIVAVEMEAARAAPGVLGVFAASDLDADGIGDISCLATRLAPLARRDGLRAGTAGAGLRRRPLPRRFGRGRGGRDPRRGARRAGADRGGV